MKKVVFLFFACIFSFCLPLCTSAQSKPRTEISCAKQNGSKIEFTITSAKPFIFGSNRYILNIGTKQFFLHRQWKENGAGKMTFYIPAEDFNNLNEGDGIYLTYGTIFRNEDENAREELSKGNSRCWSMGKFNKNILVK